jgi:hypothetical protein
VAFLLELSGCALCVRRGGDGQRSLPSRAQHLPLAFHSSPARRTRARTWPRRRSAVLCPYDAPSNRNTCLGGASARVSR